MTITSPAAVVSSTGIVAPSYSEILAYLQDKMRSIHGSDIYLGADSQDGQLLAVFAKALDDCNSTAVAVYNSFSPATAQGVGLSNNVKINHIARALPSNSQVNVTIVGQVGTTITSGQVGDSGGNKWNLPTSVVIPPAGNIIVTATCDVLGAVAAAVGTVTQILTPAAGWQTVTNATVASLGNPNETDAELRRRQTNSTALRSDTVLDGIVGNIEALSGVTDVMPYENDTNATDANGLPPHSIAMVVQGGDATAIASTIFRLKAPGVATHGTTSIVVTDNAGTPRTIKFFVPTPVPIGVAITLHAFTGYTTTIRDAIKQAVADYINALSIGSDVLVIRLILPAMLNGGVDSTTFELVSVLAATTPSAPGSADIVIAFASRATCSVADISVTVV